ncbi:MAG: ABC transporter ATP-binding protein [Anaerolineae bacterium]|nr:ABC transporter ATP-binding protein [Anaerolineae bacterium]
MSAEPLLQVENLTTRFEANDGTVFAVNGISYTLQEGETLGIVGESGCGKSVHALSIMRLIPIPPGRIADGSVKLRGKDLLQIPLDDMRKVRGKDIAMIFQDPMTSLNPVMTIGRQITEALELHMGMDMAQARARAIEMLELVGIPDAAQRLDSYPHEFSGGMRQRAMIAMALSCEPALLIADEPTTALDVTIQAQILDLVRGLREKFRMAITWITHDLGVIAGLADRVIVMYAGFIVEDSPVNDLFARPSHPYTLGLLHSLPRVDKSHGTLRLTPVKGAPPDLLGLPRGCPFAPRCPYAVQKCWEENPTLREVGEKHRVACWVDIQDISETPAGVASSQEAAQ